MRPSSGRQTNTVPQTHREPYSALRRQVWLPRFTLDAVSVGVFSKALENIASLRAQNGGTMSRLTFSDEMISQMRTNMKAALGRIVDVDIAEESTELAKNQVLVQASAAMLAQANSTTDIALMLLR